MGGLIALRGRAEQNDALKKIIAHSFAAYNATFWTAVVGVRPYSGNRCVLSWLGGASTDHAWFFWPFDALSNAAPPKTGHESYVDCKLKLPNICEKKPVVY
ncbi:hypothetical protein AAVH_18573 [Aphelenchoides avenae]|nr:hypothetical protein AAVH_18573 [Aphelenchus avenae]